MFSSIKNFMPKFNVTSFKVICRARLTWSEAWGTHYVNAPPLYNIKLQNSYLNAHKCMRFIDIANFKSHFCVEKCYIL